MDEKILQIAGNFTLWRKSIAGDRWGCL